MVPRHQPCATGLAVAQHPLGRRIFRRRWSLLEEMEAGFRGGNMQFGEKVGATAAMYQSARRMMFNNAVEPAFTFTEEESARLDTVRFAG